MTELLAAILGAVAGAAAAYFFDIRKDLAARHQNEQDAQRERRRLRSSIATVLLHDLRMIEGYLIQFYNMPMPATWVGQRRTLYFDALRSEVILFNAESITKIDEFYWQADNLFSTLGSASTEVRGTERFNHFLRVLAGFALQALPDAKDALLQEGGSMPNLRVMETVEAPDLPKIPAPSFLDIRTPGAGGSA